MNIDWYENYLMVTKYLNYQKASEQLFISAPTLHNQIKKIEKELGIILFYKQGRKLVLTSAGKEIVTHAKTIIYHHKKLITAAKNTQNNKGSSH